MPLSQPQHNQLCQKRKLSALFSFGALLVAIVVCSVARYSAPVNDWLSGPPHYARSIANMLAEDMGGKFRGMAPVIVTEQQDSYCEPLKPLRPVKAADLYVITYSERAQSLCVTQWQRAGTNSEPKTTTISEATGHNYGRHIEGDVRVVIRQHFPIRFPSDFLSSLHWRSNSWPVARLGTFQVFQFHDLSIQRELESFPISIANLRNKVAERHNFVNQLLSFSLGLLIGMLVTVVLWIGLLYRRTRRDCAAYGFHVSLTKYLYTAVSDLTKQAYECHSAQQCQRQGELRAEKILRHSLDGTRASLEALLVTMADDRERSRIQSCLIRNDLLEMKRLLGRLEKRRAEKTPEERLGLLLESLKEYCVSSDFDSYRTSAFGLFRRRGFRNARDFVVGAHSELRRRARQAERNKMAQQNSAAPSTQRNGSKSEPLQPTVHHSGNRHS